MPADDTILITVLDTPIGPLSLLAQAGRQLRMVRVIRRLRAGCG